MALGIILSTLIDLEGQLRSGWNLSLGLCPVLNKIGECEVRKKIHNSLFLAVAVTNWFKFLLP